ncbi:MAG TPA: hypothetical protein VLH19_01905 [Patescibacteria group bacterium]|nr:hypothetical protein [Patescibacteria group bacterium]
MKLRSVSVWILFTVVSTLLIFLRRSDLISAGLFALGVGIGFICSVLIDVLFPSSNGQIPAVSKEQVRQVISQTVSEVKTVGTYKQVQARNPLRSYPALAAYFVAAFFVISSTSSFLGRGVVLGLGLSLVTDLYISKTSLAGLRSRWFSLFPVNLSDSELVIFVWLVCGVFSVLSLIAVLV